MRAYVVPQKHQIAELEKQVAEYKAREESRSTSNSEKDDEIKRLLAREEELQKQACISFLKRQMCTSISRPPRSSRIMSELIQFEALHSESRR